ncbi:alpha-amylase family protein [Thalassotalea agariperforans]
MKKNLILLLRKPYLALIVLLAMQSGKTFAAQISTEKINTLVTLVNQAKIKNIDVTREEMTLTMAELFSAWAEWDENNQTINSEFYLKHPVYKTSAAEHAANLPDYQRSSVNTILDQAIEELIQVNNGTIIRKPVPNVAFDKVVVGDRSFLLNNSPVFLNTYTWKPDDPQTNPYFGNLNSQFISPNFIKNASGDVNQSQYNNINNDHDERIGQVFVSHSGIPDWTNTAYSNFTDGSRLFSKYDIDHPNARTLFANLFEKFIPILKDKRSSELGYMLFNEPSFFTQAGVWNTGEVSNYTKEKFKVWLTKKHSSISQLNLLWRSNYNTFDDIDISIPMSGDLQGSAIWFDWMRFNQLRVTDWFSFLTSEIKKHDPEGKTHIKLMPWLWNGNKRDHGIDFEALLSLTDIIGFDANSEYRNLRKTESYQAEYSFDWQSPIISFDFFSSVQPQQLLWDSENHFFTKVAFQEKDIDPAYVNAIYWLAATHGLSGTSTWVWGRNTDGSIISSRGTNSEYITDITHQPIGFHTLTRTIMDINANMADTVKLQQLKKPIRLFYSEVSAINQNNYMESIRQAHKKLFFEGLPLGFATENIINKQANSWPVVVIKNTPQVTSNELLAIQQYIDNKGTVLIDNTSLLFDEYNNPHPSSQIPAGEQVIYYQSDDELKEKILALTSIKALLPEVNVIEANNDKKVAWRIAQKTDNTYVLSMINTGKQPIELKIAAKQNNKRLFLTNLLNGQNIDTDLSLAAKQHLLVEVEVISEDIEEETVTTIPPLTPPVNTPDKDNNTNETSNEASTPQSTEKQTGNISGGSISFIHLFILGLAISLIQLSRALKKGV